MQESSFFPLIFVCVGLFMLMVILLPAIQIVPEHKRAVIFRLGRFVGVVGPGVIFIIPFVDRAVMVEVRDQTRTLEAQSAISADNVRLTADLTWNYRVTDPAKIILNVANLDGALQKIAQEAWRDRVEAQPYAETIRDRPQVREEILRQLQTASANWGVEIVSVQLGEIKQG
jgi:regulator of protease activity HflC (stomatin/prohibitin superfamily)